MKLGNHEASPVFPNDLSLAWDLALRSPPSPTVRLAVAIYLCWPSTAHPLPKNDVKDSGYDVVEWGRKGFMALMAANISMYEFTEAGEEAYVFLQKSLHFFSEAEERASFLDETPKPL
jgi:hypothetical protein